MKKTLSKEDFLARCGNAYDAGLITVSHLALLNKWLDFVMRLEGGQMNYVAEFFESERYRLENFVGHSTLANDREGYGLINLAAILNHPCQLCATSPSAWWTRAAMCEHEERRNPGKGF